MDSRSFRKFLSPQPPSSSSLLTDETASQSELENVRHVSRALTNGPPTPANGFDIVYRLINIISRTGLKMDTAFMLKLRDRAGRYQLKYTIDCMQ
jgi:hypothetical protein